MNRKENRKTGRQEHRLCSSHPVIAMILFMTGASLAVQFIWGVFEVICSVAGPGKDFDIGYLFGVLASFILLYIFKWWFRPDYRGSVKPSVDPGSVFRLTALAAVYWILGLGVLWAYNGFYFKPTLNTILLSLFAGVNEEAAYRALTVPLGMRYLKDDSKKLWVTVVLTSSVFGLVHTTNLFAGAAAGATVIQVIGAVMIGIFCCALFLRTGSILPAMVAHMITDFIAISTSPVITSSEGVDKTVISWVNVWDLAATILLALIGLYLLRKSKRDEILRIWEEKWSGVKKESER